MPLTFKQQQGANDRLGARVSELETENERLRAALAEVRKWIMDPFGPEDFNSKILNPAFTKALKMVHTALKR